MGAKPPRIWGEWLYNGEEHALHIRLDSGAWFTWLAAATTRSFSYPVYDHAHGYIDGFMTVRKERRQRGRDYWVAYRRARGQVRKIYLGAATVLTKQRLDRLAQTFLAAGQDFSTPDGKDEDS